MELTPEDRRRIYEEEKARLRARRGLQPQKSVTPMVIIGIVAFSVIILIVRGNLVEQPRTFQVEGGTQLATSPSSSASGLRTLRATYWCAESFDDAGQIAIAVSRSDTAAIAGMLARGNAFQVERGTQVVTGGETDMGLSLVHIESGFQAGRKCYLPTNALRQQ